MSINEPVGGFSLVAQVDLTPPDCPPVAIDAIEVPELPICQQVAMDEVDEASMESFPCSDPPAYTMRHM